MLILTNGLWLAALPYFNAALWIAAANSLQYLCLVSYVHVKDHGSRPDARGSSGFYYAIFYLATALLAVAVFFGVPYAIRVGGSWAGQPVSAVQSAWMV